MYQLYTHTLSETPQHTQDLTNASITAFFAILVFVTGRIIEKMFIRPIQDQRKVIGRIVYALTFYANRAPFRNEDSELVNREELNEASKEIRNLSASLRATSRPIPFYDLLNACSVVPSKNEIGEISVNLIGWSNSLHNDDKEGRYNAKKQLPRF